MIVGHKYCIYRAKLIARIQVEAEPGVAPAVRVRLFTVVISLGPVSVLG